MTAVVSFLVMWFLTLLNTTVVLTRCQQTNVAFTIFKIYRFDA